MLGISGAENKPKSRWTTAFLFSLLFHLVLAASLHLDPGPDISDPPRRRLVYCLTPRGCVAVWVDVSSSEGTRPTSEWRYVFPVKP